jgi:hypothetical protein
MGNQIASNPNAIPVLMWMRLDNEKCIPGTVLTGTIFMEVLMDSILPCCLDLKFFGKEHVHIKHTRNRKHHKRHTYHYYANHTFYKVINKLFDFPNGILNYYDYYYFLS